MAKAGFGDIKVNLAGVKAVLKSKAVAGELERRARAIADDASERAAERAHGYADDKFFDVGGPRPGERKTFATVHGTKKMAHAVQARHDVLTQAIDAGRK